MNNDPENDKRDKKRRRARFDWLNAQWSPTNGFALTGAGAIGVAVIVVIWLVVGHDPRAKETNQAGPPATTTSSPAPTTTVVTTAPPTTPAQQVGGGRPQTSSRTSETTQPEPPTPNLITFGTGRVKPDADRQDCETGYQFNFSQEITVTKPDTITYRWERSDGAIQSEPATIEFDSPGTKTVTDWWQRFGEPGDQLTGSEWIHILGRDTQEVTSLPIPYDYVCP
jgi:hypothetical protein